MLRNRSIPASVILILLVGAATASPDEAPSFYRGLNLNGPPVVIDGHPWDGHDARNYVCKDRAFDNQNVPLVPSTDPERAKMIRSSRWGGNRNRVELTEVPAGIYTVFLYVWEDNNSETFSISLNDREVASRYNSGKAGHWDRLGPWYIDVTDGTIRLTSQGGAANFSGIEVWRGRYDGKNAVLLAPDDVAFFESRIRPLLIQHCYECHSAEAKEVQGALLVDSAPGLRQGGALGPAVIPGDVEHSKLIEAVRYKNADLQMPPDGKLSDREIADLEDWIRRGAPDPRTTATRMPQKKIDVAKAREFWSLRPVVDPPVPSIQNATWPLNDLDRFILARLEAQGVHPLGDADKRILIRRVTYDLVGLPPTPEEIDAFLADDSPQAFERVVDRLLESPRYGERWGRHWLDVVRYADTAGDNSDFPIPQMYRYRDWVIDAFNRDLPYDQFVQQQLAGDLLPSESDEQKHQQIIATGYIANARRFGSRVDDYPQHLTIEDTIDNLGRAFLGLTLNCARCHDHKFDPVTTDDYYGLYGIFHSTRYPWPGIELEQKQRDLVPLVSAEEVAAALKGRKEKQAELDAEVKRLDKERKDAAGDEKSKLDKAYQEAKKAADDHAKSPLPFEQAYAVAEAAKIEDAAVQLKGDPAKTGAIIPRRFLTVLGGMELPPDDRTSGRLALANWIVDPQNPLTARVMANRIWRGHFGKGIVPTPNDFGKQGKPPTHPELLDWLACRLVEGRGLRGESQRNASDRGLLSDSQLSTLNSQPPRPWSIKAMHRLIVLSHTYQLASGAVDARDPNNDLYGVYPRRRLDAEAIRDTLLVLGGNLDTSPAGPHPFPPQTTWKFTQHNPFKAVYETNRRSVYLMTQRIQRHPYLAIFDGPDPAASTPTRLTSTTPLQALYLLNDPFVHQQSQLFAKRVLSERPDDATRLDRAFQLALGRSPESAEREDALRFLAEVRDQFRVSETPAEQIDLQAWQALIRAVLRLNEFVYVD